MNDTDRRQWVENDEGLYDLYKSSRQPLRQWIKENRTTIDQVAGNVMDGTKRQSYLKYGN